MELEEKNLTLIGHCQESEEMLDEVKSKMKSAHFNMNTETETLKAQIAVLEKQLEKETSGDVKGFYFIVECNSRDMKLDGDGY